MGKGGRIWCGNSRKSGLYIAGEGGRCCQRSYHVEYTGSRPIAEVKPHWAALVLSWVTRWEYAVLLALSLFCLFFFPSSFLSSPSLFYTASKRNRLLQFTLLLAQPERQPLNGFLRQCLWVRVWAMVADLDKAFNSSSLILSPALLISSFSVKS